MRPSIAVVVACIVFATTDAIRFQPIDWNSYPQISNDKRDATGDTDPETLRLLMGLYQKLQSEGLQSELKRKLWPAQPVSRINPDTLSQAEMAALAGVADKKSSDRNTRNYKNCFLSPVQCVMKGRA